MALCAHSTPAARETSRPRYSCTNVPYAPPHAMHQFQEARVCDRLVSIHEIRITFQTVANPGATIARIASGTAG